MAPGAAIGTTSSGSDPNPSRNCIAMSAYPVMGFRPRGSALALCVAGVRRSSSSHFDPDEFIELHQASGLAFRSSLRLAGFRYRSQGFRNFAQRVLSTAA